jgi:hypothetical protein
MLLVLLWGYIPTNPPKAEKPINWKYMNAPILPAITAKQHSALEGIGCVPCHSRADREL